MIFSISQRNNFISIALIPILVLGLWAPYIIEPHMIAQYYDKAPMPLYKPLIDIYISQPYIGLLLMFGVMTINMVILSSINSSLRLIEKRSNLFLLLYIIFSAILPDFQQFNPMQFSLMWILLGVYSIFKLYKNEYELRSVFEAGFYFSVAGLFYANAFFLSIVVFIGIVVLVPFNWRQWIAGIFGLLTPLVFLFSWAFVSDKLHFILPIIEKNTFVWHKTLNIQIIELGCIALVALLFVASLFYTFSGVIKKVAIQKYFLIFFLLFSVVIITYITVPSVGIDAFFFLIIPLIFYLSNYLLNMAIWVVPEFLTTILLVYVVLLQFI